MISKKYFKIVFSFLMSLTMVMVMSFFMIYINFGFVENFFKLWINAIFKNFLIGFSTSMIASSFMAKVAHKICSK